MNMVYYEARTVDSNTDLDFIPLEIAPVVIVDMLFTLGDNWTDNIIIAYEPPFPAVVRFVCNFPGEDGDTINFRSLLLTNPILVSFLLDGSGEDAYVDFMWTGAQWKLAGCSGYKRAPL
jgi:hypothetical protein